jgi:hypothetical protein
MPHHQSTALHVSLSTKYYVLRTHDDQTAKHSEKYRIWILTQDKNHKTFPVGVALKNNARLMKFWLRKFSTMS